MPRELVWINQPGFRGWGCFSMRLGLRPYRPARRGDVRSDETELRVENLLLCGAGRRVLPHFLDAGAKCRGAGMHCKEAVNETPALAFVVIARFNKSSPRNPANRPANDTERILRAQLPRMNAASIGSERP